MALSGPRVTILACRNCRITLLKSLFPETFKSFSRHAFPYTRRLRTITSIVSSKSSNETTELSKVEVNIKDDDGRKDLVEYTSSNVQDSEIQDLSLPWYLREPAGPSREERLPDAIVDRQRLPELPSYAPPILQPLLEHVSVGIGLDDLRLLDLRRIDPPPALGANLLMIIGTARSEKHLHVSADRLCRWLRSTYKLCPEADGLLGRNELKLKLKRRARRKKMLASVNALDRPNRDDGISTDWVCVNIGQVDPAADAPDFIQRRPGFVGFGAQTKRVTIVVQMLTEDKRLEMDLEGLWKTVQKVKDMNKPSTESEVADPGEVIPASIPEKNGSFNTEAERSVSNKSASFLTRPVTIQSVQMRGFHYGTKPHLFSDADRRARHLADQYTSSTPASSIQPSTQDLIQELFDKSPAEALLSLGKGAKDQSSTNFLNELYKSIPDFPTIIHWECLADLYVHAMKLRHPFYTVEDMDSLVSKVQLSGVDISESFFCKAFEAMLMPLADQIVDGQPVRASMIKAAKIMTKMENYGYDPLSGRTILLLNKSITPMLTFSDEDRGREISVTLHDQLHNIMDAAGVTPTEEQFYEQLLTSCAQLGHWRGFWNVWQGMARRSLARSANLYKLAFASVADTGHQSRCLAALRYCVPQMRKEDPPVNIESALAGTVKRCVMIAEPDIESQASSETIVEGEFVPLWNRCETILASK